MPRLDQPRSDDPQRVDHFCDLVEDKTGEMPVKVGENFKGLCPAHEDSKPSLSIRTSPFGFECFVGCTGNEIAAALNSNVYALKRGPLPDPTSSQPGEAGREGSATSDRDTRKSGRADDLGEEVARYPYVDEDGTPLYYNIRFEPKDFRMATAAGKIGTLPKSLRRVPYRLDKLAEAIEQGKTIYFVEGEKDVHSIEAQGGYATCLANGISGKWLDEWAEYFEDADVVVICDNDKAGRKFGRYIANSMVNGVRSVRLALPKLITLKADVTDHLEAGYGLDDLAWLPERMVRKTEFDYADLLTSPIVPLRWCIPGVIPEGLTLLVGAPKAGKSWMNLAIVNGLSTGRLADIIGWSQNSDPQQVLYLALEDPKRRVQERGLKVLDDIPPPAPGMVTIWLATPPLADGGREKIERWLDAHPDATCVLVDVLAKAKGPSTGGGNSNAYQADYETIAILKDIADEYGISVIVTHHDRKSGADDILDVVSGTKGVTGAADTILYLQRKRDSNEGKLFIESRDVESTTYAIEFHSPNGRWTFVESGVAMPDTRNVGGTSAGKLSTEDEIVETIRAAGPLSMDRLTEILDHRTEAALRKACSRARSEGLLLKDAVGDWSLAERQ